MNEESTEIFQEIEITVEEVPADALASGTSTGNDELTAGTEMMEDSTELLPEDSTEFLPEDSTESLSEDSTELLPEDSTELLLEDSTELPADEDAEAVVLADDTATVQALEQIHYDLLVIIFLLLLFWLYERFRNGIRSFKKWTN